MLRYTAENIANALKQRYSPEGFLSQYAEAEGQHVTLGDGVIDERDGLSVVTYPLVIGGQISDNRYSVDARGIYSTSPEIIAVSFSGKHPLAIGATLVQIVARSERGRFVRGNDLWLDIVFPGIELPSEKQELKAQPLPQWRVATAVAPALPERVVRDIEHILQRRRF